MTTVLFIHTVPGLVQVFDRLAESHLPGLHRMHILDEPLLAGIRRRGSLQPPDAERLFSHLQAGASAGAQAALVSCSTVSPCIDLLEGRLPIQTVKVDEAMVAEAVRRGERIALVATNPATLGPSQALLEAEARRQGRQVSIHAVAVPEAFSALQMGELEQHDRLVWQAVTALPRETDVVVLAQASMARVLDICPAPDLPFPVLTSPGMAVERLKAVLETVRPR